MSTGRRRGRPTIHEQAMTPTERQQRWRAKVKAAEIRASRAEWSVAPPPPRYRHKEPPVVMGELVMERQAYVTLLAPMDELRVIAEVEGKVTALLEQMSPDQRVVLGRCARRAMEVVAILAAIPDDLPKPD